MALLTVQHPANSGVALTYAAATTGPGDTFRNTGKEFLSVVNGSGSPITVTFDSPNTCSFGLAANPAHDDVVTVAAGVTELIGPFDKDRHNTTAGLIVVTYSSVTTVTVAALASS